MKGLIALEKNKTVVCEIEAVFDMIGGKWKPLILCLLKDSGALRHGAMLKTMTGISQKMLTHQLRDLEADGFISKTIFPEIPPRVEYQLTEKGHSVMPILDSMCAWYDEHPSARYQFIRPLCPD